MNQNYQSSASSDRQMLVTRNAQMSGTTATLAVHDHRSNKITVAHVADTWPFDLVKFLGEEFCREFPPGFSGEFVKLNLSGEMMC